MRRYFRVEDQNNRFNRQILVFDSNKEGDKLLDQQLSISIGHDQFLFGFSILKELHFKTYKEERKIIWKFGNLVKLWTLFDLLYHPADLEHYNFCIGEKGIPFIDFKRTKIYYKYDSSREKKHWELITEGWETKFTYERLLEWIIRNL